MNRTVFEPDGQRVGASFRPALVAVTAPSAADLVQINGLDLIR